MQEISENTRHSLNFISNFDGMVMVKRFGVLAKINCLRTYFELKRAKWTIFILSKRVDLHAIYIIRMGGTYECCHCVIIFLLSCLIQ